MCPRNSLRLYQLTSGGAVRKFLYAPGDSGLPEAVSEYDGSGTLLAHHAFGPGPDEPLLWWDGGAGFALRSLHADERGSIVAVGNGSGGTAAINSYDEFGRPGAGNAGRMQYTGQLWLPEIGVYYYKARMYDPRLGRFLQTDPIGYRAGPNLYAYVRNDPVNFTDPLGLLRQYTMPTDQFLDGMVAERIIVTGNRDPDRFRDAFLLGGASYGIDGGGPYYDGGGGATTPPTAPTPKPQPKKVEPKKRDIVKFCENLMSVVIPVGGVGYGALEGIEFAGYVARSSVMLGARGAAAGPWGALGGAAVGGITAWLIITYGPDVIIPEVCRGERGSVAG
ncbi:MAG TPA: RHS repeat-associated core domain-containing protein [Sphingomicrobium sp.]|nr:RHS repeat-associated core domain-containing protein [Sphingomicrobium sp.]